MLIAIHSFLRRLGRDNRGLSFVELAFAAPVLLLLLTGGIELANYIVARMKVTRVATMMADLTAQSPVGVHESDISDLFLSANMVTEPLDILEHGRIYVTAVRGGGSRVGNSILWQRCDGKRTDFRSTIGSSNNKYVGLPSRIELETDAVTVVAQATMAYEPMLYDALFPENTRISHVAVYMPRSLSFGVITSDAPAKDNCGTNVTQYDAEGRRV